MHVCECAWIQPGSFAPLKCNEACVYLFMAQRTCLKIQSTVTTSSLNPHGAHAAAKKSLQLSQQITSIAPFLWQSNPAGQVKTAKSSQHKLPFSKNPHKYGNTKVLNHTNKYRLNQITCFAMKQSMQHAVKHTECWPLA